MNEDAGFDKALLEKKFLNTIEVHHGLLNTLLIKIYKYDPEIEPYLHIMITGECNYKCRYCLADTVMKRTEKMIGKATKRGKGEEWYKRFRDNNLKLIASFPGENILFSGGEPILTTKLDEYPYLGAYLEQAGRTDNKNRKIRILTNSFSIPDNREDAIKFYKELLGKVGDCKLQLEFSYDPDKLKHYADKNQEGMLENKIAWAKEFARHYTKFSVFVLNLMPGERKVMDDYKFKNLMPQGKGARFKAKKEGFPGPECIDIGKLCGDIKHSNNVGIIVRPDGLIVTTQIFAYTSPIKLATVGSIIGDSLDDIAKKLFSLLMNQINLDSIAFSSEYSEFSGINKVRLTKKQIASEIFQKLRVNDPFGGLNPYFHKWLAELDEKKKEEWIRYLVHEFTRHLSSYGKLDFTKYWNVKLTFRSGKIKETLEPNDIPYGTHTPFSNPLLFFGNYLAAYESLLERKFDSPERNQFLDGIAKKLNISIEGASKILGHAQAKILVGIIKKTNHMRDVDEFHKKILKSDDYQRGLAVVLITTGTKYLHLGFYYLPALYYITEDPVERKWAVGGVRDYFRHWGGGKVELSILT